jgi:hypothetical protein
VRSFCWLILFTLCMHGIETVTLLAYVGFVLRLCMQYVGNGQERKGRSMELGGVREGGAIGRNRTSPPPGSAAAIGTTAAPDPNGTFTSAGIGTSKAPGPNGTSTSAGIGTSATSRMMPPLVQPLATTAQDQLNLMTPPFRPRRRPPPLLWPIEMPPPATSAH